MTARNGSGEWHGNVQDGAGTVTVRNTPATGDPSVATTRRMAPRQSSAPSEGKAPASVTSQPSLASYAAVTWHRHGKAGQ